MFYITEKDYYKILLVTLAILILMLYLLSDTGIVLSIQKGHPENCFGLL